MGQVGFGAYRISIRSKEHRSALEAALASGCSLIDTSSNYTNGESEELIGAILQDNPQFQPIIVTKAGYIQGRNLEVLKELNKKNKALEDLVVISEDLMHSIHPDFLQNQLEQSLARLKKDSVDYFLLHNPEYYFEVEGATQEEFYRRLKKAFFYCEEEVLKGRIKSYGISSNNFVLPLNDPHVTNLQKILTILEEIKAKNFKMVQFPFNLIEINALEKLGDYGDESLLELCLRNGLTTVINRPLNAFVNNSLVRFATYENLYKDLNEEEASKLFEQCMSLLKSKWDEGSDEIVTSSDFDETDIIVQFKKLWNTLPTPDAVDQVYYGHFFPFVARVWGRALSVEESQVFYELMEYSELYSRKNLSDKAQDFQKQAQQVGLLPENESRPLATMAIETYLDYGFDYVLVGMKKPEYVDQLKHLF